MDIGMKKYIVCLFLVSPAVFSSPYKYPEIIDVNLSCHIEKEKLRKIIEEESYNEECPNSGIKVKSVDLNSDGKCELFATTDRGRRCTPTTRLIYEDDRRNALLVLDGGAINTFASKRNGYYRLIHYTWGGYRTNMIRTTNIYYFDGKEYRCEFCKNSSHGGYLDLAKKAYDHKQYDLAETYYWNAYAMNGERKISDANNLAIAYIKNGNAKKAITLLEKHLSISDKEMQLSESSPCDYADCPSSEQKIKQLRASAYFNKGLAYESMGDIDNAIIEYKKSQRIKNNSSIKLRVEKLKSNGKI